MKIYLFTFFIIATNIAYAGNTYTGGNDYYTISEITPYSAVEPQNPNWAGKTQVKFTSSISWLGASGCSSDSVVIREDDSNILSLILQAFAMNKSIRLYADNNQTITGTDKCILRALSLKY